MDSAAVMWLYGMYEGYSAYLQAAYEPIQSDGCPRWCHGPWHVLLLVWALPNTIVRPMRATPEARAQHLPMYGSQAPSEADGSREAAPGSRAIESSAGLCPPHCI